MIKRNHEKNVFLVILILQSFFITAQKFDKKYFVQTFWFVDNNYDEFNKSDTLKFIKHAKFVPEWSGNEEVCNLKEYNESEKRNAGHGLLVELRFKKRNRLHIQWRIQRAMYLSEIHPWIWKYKKSDSTITIYDNEKKVILKFRPLFEKHIEVYSESEKKLVKNIELIVVRIK